MRDYGKVAPTFWARGSGKHLRGHPSAQILALYLFTAPGASMTGLFYLSVPVICHETGLSTDDFHLAIDKLDELGIAHYDDDAELVWVPEMARYQIGAELHIKDKRIKGVERAIAPFAGHAFYDELVERYKVPFNLSIEAPAPQPRTPRKGPSKGARCQGKSVSEKGLISGSGSLPDPSEPPPEMDPETAGARVAASVPDNPPNGRPAEPTGSGQGTLALGDSAPKPPPRLAKTKTHRESVRSAEHRYAEAFAAGQTDASGLPFTPPTDNGAQYAFRTGLRTHAVDAGGVRLCATELDVWIRQKSADYRRAKPGDAEYGGFTPRKMFAWLDGGGAIATSGHRARASPALQRPAANDEIKWTSAQELDM